MRIQWSIATLSWIDPVTGLPEVDRGGDPGGFVSRGAILAKSGYRFSNFLEAWIEVNPRTKEVYAGFSSDSGMYRGASFLGTESAQVGGVGRAITRKPSEATFRQLVGCRTEAPEKIGRTVGAGAGGALGAGLAGPVGYYAGDYVGGRAGRAAAEQAKVFPPIWSELELTIKVDGSFTHALIRHSLFPSVSYYAPETQKMYTGVYKRIWQYNAVPMLDSWYERGWGPSPAASPIGAGRLGGAPTTGNPWGMTKPTLGGPSTLQDQPQGY